MLKNGRFQVTHPTIFVRFKIALQDVGGIEGLLASQPTETITFAQALTMVFGTFVSGGTQAATSSGRRRGGCSTWLARS